MAYGLTLIGLKCLTFEPRPPEQRVWGDRGVKLRLVRVHKGRGGWADDAAADYCKRLKRYGAFEERTVRPQAFSGDIGMVQRTEAERIARGLRPGDRLVVLDERGESLNSHGWSKLIDDARHDGVATLVFALGGPYGHGACLRSRASHVISLSPMVLNHQVARVVVLEQLYRAWTLIRGEPYHH
jgi:23S rRNA (pseudouridine1915-N3)-methyltransferase